jgi:hypothetical protein
MHLHTLQRGDDKQSKQAGGGLAASVLKGAAAARYDDALSKGIHKGVVMGGRQFAINGDDTLYDPTLLGGGGDDASKLSSATLRRLAARLDEYISLELWTRQLRPPSLMQTLNPYIEVYRERSHIWEKVMSTETHVRDAAPHFGHFVVRMLTLCHGSYQHRIQLRVMTRVEGGAKALVGTCVTSIASIFNELEEFGALVINLTLPKTRLGLVGHDGTALKHRALANGEDGGDNDGTGNDKARGSVLTAAERARKALGENGLGTDGVNAAHKKAGKKGERGTRGQVIVKRAGFWTNMTKAVLNLANNSRLYVNPTNCIVRLSFACQNVQTAQMGKSDPYVEVGNASAFVTFICALCALRAQQLTINMQLRFSFSAVPRLRRGRRLRACLLVGGAASDGAPRVQRGHAHRRFAVWGTL